MTIFLKTEKHPQTLFARLQLSHWSVCTLHRPSQMFWQTSAILAMSRVCLAKDARLPNYEAECSLWSGRKVNSADEVKCTRFIVPTLFVLVEQVKIGEKQ